MSWSINNAAESLLAAQGFRAPLSLNLTLNFSALDPRELKTLGDWGSCSLARTAQSPCRLEIDRE